MSASVRPGPICVITAPISTAPNLATKTFDSTGCFLALEYPKAILVKSKALQTINKCVKRREGGRGVSSAACSLPGSSAIGRGDAAARAGPHAGLRSGDGMDPLNLSQEWSRPWPWLWLELELEP